MQVKLQALRDGAKWPKRATEGSAGVDLCACLEGGSVCVEPMERVLIPTGFAMELPGAQYVALLFSRSGLATKQGLSLSNGVGVIDSDYRGEICVSLCNLSQKTVEIQDGERIAQLLVMPIAQAVFVPGESLGETQRGKGGFGSTGYQ